MAKSNTETYPFAVTIAGEDHIAEITRKPGKKYIKLYTVEYE